MKMQPELQLRATVAVNKSYFCGGHVCARSYSSQHTHTHTNKLTVSSLHCVHKNWARWQKMFTFHKTPRRQRREWKHLGGGEEKKKLKSLYGCDEHLHLAIERRGIKWKWYSWVLIFFFKGTVGAVFLDGSEMQVSSSTRPPLFKRQKERKAKNSSTAHFHSLFFIHIHLSILQWNCIHT